MPFKVSVPFPYNKDHSKLPTITLREAAQTGRDKLKCICKKGCKDKHCACRAAGFNSNSHCHPKSLSCTKYGKFPAKKATATSDEKLDEAVKQGKWFGDVHINEAVPIFGRFHNSYYLLGQNLSFSYQSFKYFMLKEITGLQSHTYHLIV